MSIWSSINLAHSELWTLGYGAPGDDRSDNLGASWVIGDTFLDLATATPWYGNTGVRLIVRDETDTEACVVVPRATAEALRDALTAWLEETQEFTK